MNVRMTLDIPVHFLPALERSLGKQGLAIRPYIKHGVQRWMLMANHDHKPAIPDTMIAAGVQVPLCAHGHEVAQ